MRSDSYFAVNNVNAYPYIPLYVAGVVFFARTGMNRRRRRMAAAASKFHELLSGALQGARTYHLMLICYIMLIAGRLARRPKGAREIC